MARVVVVGGGFGGLATAARLAKLGHDVTLARALGRPRRRAVLGRARTASPGTPGRRSRCCRRCVRDLFRKSGRPLGARARAGAARRGARAPLRGRHVGRGCRRLAGRAARGVRRARAGPRAGAGSTTSRRTPTTGRCCAAATSRRPWDRDAPARASWPPGSTAGRCCTSGCAGRSRTSGCGWWPGTRFVAEGHDLRNVPAWARRDGVRRAAVRRVDRRRAAWPPLGDGAGRPAGHPQGRPSLTSTPRPRPGAARRAGWSRWRPTPASVDADVVVCAIDPRRLPALAPYVERTMPAIPPVVCPPRARGRRARPAARGRAARRPDAGRAHRRPGARRRRGLDGARARPARRGPAASRWPGSASTSATHVVTRVDRSPRDLVERVGRLAAGRAVAGPRDGAPPARARPPRSRACTPPARTPPPAPGCRSSGLSAALVAQAVGPARGEPRQTVMLSAAKISQRRLGAVQRVEVQPRRAAGQQLLAQLGGDRDALGAHRRRVALVGGDPRRRPRRAPRVPDSSAIRGSGCRFGSA